MFAINTATRGVTGEFAANPVGEEQKVERVNMGMLQLISNTVPEHVTMMASTIVVNVIVFQERQDPAVQVF